MSNQLATSPILHRCDPLLPGLPKILCTRFIGSQIQDQLGGLAGTDGSETTLQYVRYKPHRRCLAVHRLASSLVANNFSDSDPLRIEIIAKALTKESFEKRFQALQYRASDHQMWLVDHEDQIIYLRFPLDDRLQAVQKAYNPDSRTRVLRRMLGAKHGWQPRSLQRLAYKPERRYVGLVQDHDGVKRVVKLHSAERFDDAVQRLVLLDKASIGAPRILHVSPRYHSVCLQYVDGNSLGDAIYGGQYPRELIKAVGMKLARLHHQSLAAQWSTVTAPQHERLSEIAASLLFLSPQLGQRAKEVVNDTLRHLAGTQSEIALCHGDFYAKQVIVDNDNIHFIDFDQAGPADRYQDVANFVAQLYWRNLIMESETNDPLAISNAFLDGYRRGSRQFVEDRFRAQVAAALLRCAMHPFRNAIPNWEVGTAKRLQLAHSALTAAQLPSP